MTINPRSVDDRLGFDREDRVRLLNEDEILSSGDYFLFWAHSAIRAHENPAIDLAVHLANQFDAGVFVYQGISESYPYASDRHHYFQLEGAQDFARECHERGLGYALYLERDGYRNDHLLELANRSMGVIVDERPVSPGREWNQSLASEAHVPVWAVDCDCIVPMRIVDPGYDRAYKYRNATKPIRENRITKTWDDPEPNIRHYVPEILGFEPLDVNNLQLEEVLNECDIDHAIAPVSHRTGGTRAGYERWQTFLSDHLENYHQLRNNPTQPEAVSRMSPYLHYGHVSPFRLAREAYEADLDGTDKFLDELITWREMAHYFCFYNSNYDQFQALPDWAQKTLNEHREDPRDVTYGWETLARAKTDDEFWNLCQEWLLRHGELHNNLRMTWAKKLLHWAETPERALQLAIDLNDRYALDGNDPNSYLGILWCFGGFDRPYDRDDPITGSLRPRSTDWHSSRTDTDQLKSIVRSSPFEAEPDIGVIGAGISGSTCARVLHDHGLDVTIYEKSRGHGGRASTRYHSNGQTVTFDLGAQYFTIKNDRSKKYLQSWLYDGVVDEWAVCPAIIEDGEITDRETDTTRHVAVPKMNELVKHISLGIEKNFETKITDLHGTSDNWILEREGNQTYQHDVIVLTAPPKQSADLIQDEQPDRAKKISSIKMHPTWCYLCELNEPIEREFDAAFVNDETPIDWIARNGSKPGRDGHNTWVVHADHKWSQSNLERSRQEIMKTLREAFLNLVEMSESSLRHEDVHRWRYSKAQNPREVGSTIQDRLVLAGDWLNGSRVEGAFLSGQHAAGQILRRLKAT